MRTKKYINKIVNIANDGKITVLSYIFEHDDFKCATGCSFYPVSKVKFKQETKKNNVVSYLLSLGYPLKEAGNTYIELKQKNSLGDLMFDLDQSFLHDYLRKETGLSKKEAFIFTCTEGARFFGKNFQGNFNTELSDTIREYEKYSL